MGHVLPILFVKATGGLAGNAEFINVLCSLGGPNEQRERMG